MNNKIIFIVTSYNCDAYIERCINSLTMQSDQDFGVIFIDDASSQGMGSLDQKDNHMKDLLTSIRHYCCFMWVIGHNRSVFNTFLRANTDIFLFYNMTNKMLLKSLYEEFLSMFKEYPKFDIFMNEFVEHHQKNKFMPLYLNVRNRFKSYDFKDTIENL